MGTALHAAPGATGSERLHGKLLELVRPQFQQAVLMVETGDPVLGHRKCRIDGCDRPGPNRSMCTSHYNRWVTDGKPDLTSWVDRADVAIRGRTPNQTCLVLQCRRGVAANLMCGSHHLRWSKAGRPDTETWCQSASPADTGKPDCVVSDCDLLAESIKLPLCRVHATRWRNNGQPSLTDFVAMCLTIGQLRFDFTGLHPHLALQIQYVLQCKADERKSKATPQLFTPLLNELRRQHGVRSMFDKTAAEWLRVMTGSVNAYGTLRALVLFAIRCLEDVEEGGGWEQEYPRQVWHLRRLPVTISGSTGGGQLRFDQIPQPWLQECAKRYARLGLCGELSITTIQRHHNAVINLAVFIDRHRPGATSPAALDREMLERWIADVAQRHHRHLRTRRAQISAINGFLTAVRRHGWAPALPALTLVHPHDYPKIPELTSRFLPEFVMVQLEDETNLQRFTAAHGQLMTRIIIGTGLRQSDTRKLRFNCLVRDPQGAPYLHYMNHKMKREAMVPITDQLAEHVARQQQIVLAASTEPTLLMPRPRGNLDGNLPLSQGSYNAALNRWLQDCKVCDETGQPVHVSPHQFRHTYATRLINQDVPLEVIRRLLDHSSMHMTAHYARLTDKTIREKWERARKVDIHGQPVMIEPDSPIADAAWMKVNLARAKMALPNGFCGLPLQQSCPHANACLDCPVFITTPEFLGQHRQHLLATNKLIATAQANGRFRMVEMNQRVAGNLQTIITALEQPEGNTDAC